MKKFLSARKVMAAVMTAALCMAGLTGCNEASATAPSAAPATQAASNTQTEAASTHVETVVLMSRVEGK